MSALAHVPLPCGGAWAQMTMSSALLKSLGVCMKGAQAALPSDDVDALARSLAALEQHQPDVGATELLLGTQTAGMYCMLNSARRAPHACPFPSDHPLWDT